MLGVEFLRGYDCVGLKYFYRRSIYKKYIFIYYSIVLEP